MEHQKLCIDHELQVAELPKKGTKIKFRNHHKMMRVPISIYADFECCQPKCSEKHGKTSEYKATHKPSGYDDKPGITHENTFPSFYENETFDGDVGKAFVKRLIEIRNEIENIPAEKMIFTEENKADYDSATVCWICEEGFPEINEENKGKIKVRDHCYFSEKYRGAAYSSCNLQLREKKFIPIIFHIFHNLKGYDSNIFIKAFYDLDEEPDCIPQNTKKFISFSFRMKNSFELRFLDSYSFMGFPLADLVSNLKEFPMMSKFFSPEDVKTE